MKLRLILLTVFVAAVAVVLGRGLPVRHWIRQASQSDTSAPSRPIEGFTPFPHDSSLKLSVLRERLLTPYRLKPDARLLLAVAEVRRLAGAPDSVVTARFAAGRWTLRCGTQELGTLAELPDFPEMLDLLTETARKQAWARGWSDDAGPERAEMARALDRLDPAAALVEADRAWATGARDARLFRDAARAYALLALETPDPSSTADAILARSLAALSFARALGSEEPTRESCLLAEAMGYSAAANDLARRLPARDPLRLYVAWEDRNLERAAALALDSEPAPASRTPAAIAAATPRRARSGVATKGRAPAAVKASARTSPAAPATVSLEAPFFHLLRLASRGEDGSWSALETRLERPGVPAALVLASGLRNPHPDASRLAAEKLLAGLAAPRTARAKAGARPWPDASTGLAELLERVEAVIGARARPRGSALFGADFARAQERAIYHAAVDRMARRSMESLGTAEMARWFAAGPRKSQAGKKAAAFRRWYEHLARAEVGRPDLAALRADVDSLAPGPAQALRSYEAMRRLFSPEDPALRDAARELVRRLDSRPDHQVELATIAERDLLALNLAGHLGDSAAGAQGAQDSLPAHPSVANLPDSSLGAMLARNLAADPGAWKAATAYVQWLEAHSKYDAARRVIERWLARSLTETGYPPEHVEARVELAHLDQLEGHPEQGLQRLADLQLGGQFPAMERSALILQDLGKPHQALAIAWAAHRARPWLPAGRALLAEIFWLQGRSGEAAKALHDGNVELSSDAWARDVAPRFVEVFRARQPEGLEAADALMRAGFDDRTTLGAIADALGAEGAHQFAFELESRLRGTGIRQMESVLLAYVHLERAKGAGSALQWIRTRVPEKDRELLCVLAYQEQHPELLWSMAPARLEGAHGDYLWLLRAAASMGAGPRDRRYAETVKHVDGARGTHHLEIARYLAGLEEESEILALAQDARQRSEIFYFIGLKTEQSGRYRDAADWYLMSVESGAMENIESRWAVRRLKLWARDGLPADRGAPPPA